MHIFVRSKLTNDAVPAIHIYTCTWYRERNRSLLYVVKMCAAASVIVKVSWKGLKSKSYCLNIGSDKQKNNHYGKNCTVIMCPNQQAHSINVITWFLRGTVKHNIPLREYLSRLSASWESGYSRTSHSNTMPIHGSLPTTLLCHAKWCLLSYQVLRIWL